MDQRHCIGSGSFHVKYFTMCVAARAATELGIRLMRQCGKLNLYARGMTPAMQRYAHFGRKYWRSLLLRF